MGRRLTNFRSGDRAETMGVVLLQGACAVATIPRQEDFGLADALATLLRRDDPFVYTEDSFLIQFKSRTEKIIAYKGSLFDELRAQDVSVLIGQVDLKTSTLDLHTLGPALAHPNFNDARGLVAYLRDGKEQLGLRDDVLHTRLMPPILRWSMADIENRATMRNVYEVLKAHLAVERWNRQQRTTGTSRQVRWTTNEVPTSAGEVQMINPARERESLTEVVPSIRALAARSHSHPELREPLTAIIRWLRDQGVDADGDGTLRMLFGYDSAMEQMRHSLSSNPTADVALVFEVIAAAPDFMNFWLHSLTANGQGDGRRYHGHPDELRAKGFEVEVVVEGTTAKLTLGITDPWLADRGLALIPSEHDEQVPDNMVLLKKVSRAS